MAKMNIPTLRQGSLILRPFVEADVDDLHLILQEKNILEFFPSTSAPPRENVVKYINQQLVHWETHQYGWWAMALADDEKQKVIGWNGLQYLPETKEVEVGYLLSKEHWGQGLATAGAQLGIDYGFENFNFAEIIGLIHPENIASQKVLKKIGMQFTEETSYFGMDIFRYAIQRKAMA